MKITMNPTFDILRRHCNLILIEWEDLFIAVIRYFMPFSNGKSFVALECMKDLLSPYMHMRVCLKRYLYQNLIFSLF